jgi:hypothetical protein
MDAQNTCIVRGRHIQANHVRGLRPKIRILALAASEAEFPLAQREPDILDVDIAAYVSNRFWLAIVTTVRFWGAQSRAGKLMVAGAGALALGLITLYGISTSRSCSSRADVEARVALVSAQLQEAGAQGKLSVEELGQSIKRINQAAAAYDTSHDHQVYCSALDVVAKTSQLGD